MDSKNMLYHYTSAGALLSIVTKREFWATMAEYMNDKNEGILITEILTQICEQPASFAPELTQFDPKLLRVLKCSLHSFMHVSVISFSRHSRSLPMFQMYTPRAGGFVIGFPREFLNTLTEGKLIEGKLIDVEYCDKARWQWARNYALEFISEASRRDRPNKEAYQIWGEMLNSTDFLKKREIAGLTFKSDEFINEAESRIVLFGQEEHFRESNGGNYIIPYRILGIPNNKVDVVISSGPSRDQRLAHRSVLNACEASRRVGTLWNFPDSGEAKFGFRTP